MKKGGATSSKRGGAKNFIFSLLKDNWEESKKVEYIQKEKSNFKQHWISYSSHFSQSSLDCNDNRCGNNCVSILLNTQESYCQLYFDASIKIKYQKDFFLKKCEENGEKKLFCAISKEILYSFSLNFIKNFFL